MNHLLSVIGFAPSELSRKDLVQKLRVERERVRRALESWASEKFKTKPNRKKGINLTSIQAMATKIGISVEEIEQMLSEEAERRKQSAQ